LVGVLVALAFPCIAIGLLASPLCGAAPTFFAAAKKVGKESGLATASP
jgi:O-acetyl-ADP-ribose deacetylase (regulator of RNase III)